MSSALIKWLYLPDFFQVPNSTNLISECPQWGGGHGGTHGGSGWMWGSHIVCMSECM